MSLSSRSLYFVLFLLTLLQTSSCSSSTTLVKDVEKSLIVKLETTPSHNLTTPISSSKKSLPQEKNKTSNDIRIYDYCVSYLTMPFFPCAVIEKTVYLKIEDGKKNDNKLDLSFIVALAALLVSLILPFILNKKERNDSKLDEYWMREVILPRINDFMFKYTTTLIDSIKNNNPTTFQTYFASTYLSDQGALRDSFSMLSGVVKAPDVAERLEEICDELDQKISDNLTDTVDVRKRDVYWFQQEVIKYLAKCHKTG